MELVLIAFIGTIVVMAAEIAEFIGREHKVPAIATNLFHGTAPTIRAKRPDSAQPIESAYDAAA